MGKYAKETQVSSERSRQEIEKTLSKYGATGFIYGWQGSNCVVAFEMRNRRIKFTLPLPDKSNREFTHTESRGQRRSLDDQLSKWEQACRQRWRALALSIKAKLEAVECDIASFEEEFMAHIVLPSGETVGGWMIPQIETSYNNKQMPPLLGSSRA